MRTLPRLVGLGFMLLALGISGIAAETKTVVTGQRVKLKIDVPPGYSFTTETNEQGLTHIALENPVWNITLSVLISPEYTAENTTDVWQRNFVIQQSAPYLAESKEQDYQLRPLNPRQGSGVYCIFTDGQAKRVKDLEPGGFMHVVVGIKVIRGAPMYFQIFANDLTAPEYREIFDRLINSFDQG